MNCQMLSQIIQKEAKKNVVYLDIDVFLFILAFYWLLSYRIFKVVEPRGGFLSRHCFIASLEVLDKISVNLIVSSHWLESVCLCLSCILTDCDIIHYHGVTKRPVLTSNYSHDVMERISGPS